MAIKSILLAFSGNTTASGGLKLAMQMARKYEAHLTAVVSHGATVVEARYSRYLNREVLDLLRGRDAATVSTLRQDFENAVAGDLPAGSTSFLDLQKRRDFTLVEASRCYDIVVTGRRAFRPGQEHFGATPQEIALESGRPVILVPDTYDAPQINGRAVVAWDGNRAAARALSDAMHILETKELVTVLSVGSVNPDDHVGDTIGTLLERHGVKVDRLHRTRVQSGASGVAKTILEVCRESGAGLLVMGAYQRSVTREAFFGGTTVDIMTDADLPVLMSH